MNSSPLVCSCHQSNIGELIMVEDDSVAMTTILGFLFPVTFTETPNVYILANVIGFHSMMVALATLTTFVFIPIVI